LIDSSTPTQENSQETYPQSSNAHGSTTATAIFIHGLIKCKSYSKGKDESYGKVYVEGGWALDRALGTDTGRLDKNAVAMASHHG